MLQLHTNHDEKKDFILKDQLKEEELSRLHFLLNSQYQLARQKFEEKTPIHAEIKKYQRSVSMKSQQLKVLFNALSQKLREKFIRQDSECLKGLNKLQTIWESKKIQMFHRYYFQKYIENTHLKNTLTLIKNEEHLIRMDQHIYYSIQKTIWAREACLNQIKRQLRVLGPQDVYEHLQTIKDREIDANRRMEQKIYKVYGYRAKYMLDQRQAKLGQTKMELLSQDINGYRKLTFHLIELICSWKLYIQSLTHDQRLRREKIQFYHFDYNHLLTILNDSSFLSTSFLSNFYAFAVKNDPFLLKPILNLEKTMEQGGQITFQMLQLKRIIDCKLQDVPKIVLALCQLQNQVQWNIRHKKYVEKNGLIKYRSVNLQRNQSQGTIKSKKQVKLPNLPSQPSIKKTFSSIKKQKSGPLVKSNILERKTSMIENMARSSNTFQSKNFRTNNPEAKPSLKIFQNEEILTLKQQIYNKVKQQLDYQTKKSILASRMFVDLIDKQVKASFQKHLANEEQQIMRNTLQITALSFAEQQISSFITNAYKEIPVQYSTLQTQQSDLLKDISQASYCYILKVHTKDVEVANIIALCNRQAAQYKSVQVKLFSFKFQEDFEKIVLKLVQFLWKYDNVKQVGFSLRYANQQTKKFVKVLSKKLEHNCTIIEKMHKRDVQARFVFMNKDFNRRYVYNPHPQQVHFKLYAALCVQPLQLQSTNIENLARSLNYDYLVMEALRKFTNSEDFYILRDKFQPKNRYRYLLTQLMEIQNHNEYEVQMTILEAENMANLNGKLRYMKKPLIQASDLILVNNIKLMMLEYTLTIAYRLKVLSPGNGQICHRYSIHEDIPYIRDSRGTQFYMLPVQESHHLNIIVFSADDYLNHYKKGLNLYLFQTLENHKWARRHVTNMWIQMLRYPSNFTERNRFMMSTCRVHDFDSIKKELLIGDTFDWYTDIQIQNGIQYAIEQEDLHLKLPLGVGIITNKNWILYSRILQEVPRFVSENV